MRDESFYRRRKNERDVRSEMNKESVTKRCKNRRSLKTKSCRRRYAAANTDHAVFSLLCTSPTKNITCPPHQIKMIRKETHNETNKETQKYPIAEGEKK
mmetsp:Transcript_19368/g.22206  ORF Transcript_19368/g.22206 Transcript_19368/m.22206 type:complete len:99 (+) Transcript_19368:707-1003(+)